ncbi:fungal chitosanase of glycosyl hydrolase group 75-domain-containing protein [Cercophora scortea]|uniref:Endo-chitosanase n=1 Tax=Cercophora scortea TaxID=314031 RepID=A0AAE0MKN8_9PEZI|nr:fungal chitosanase of glycosyl hydrolase group 75-domain-containing protein [Cercophora scortea]
MPLPSTRHLLVLLAAWCGASTARDVPPHIREFYNAVQRNGSCTNQLATGFWATEPGGNTFSYCGDHMADYGVLYLQGRGGTLADMDIDCDGIQGGPGDDGRCDAVASPDLQLATSFKDEVAGYGKGISDLNAYVHPYVVLGNTRTRLSTKKGWPWFDPQEYGVHPLSLVAVVCGDKMVYGVWGDMNGDDGNRPMIGEASIALATACDGMGINGGSGHSKEDVLYLAFTGPEAVPGADGARWDAKSYEEFERSVEGLGDRLVKRVGGASLGAEVGEGAGKSGSGSAGERGSGHVPGSEGAGEPDQGGKNGTSQSPEESRTVRVTIDLEAVAAAVVVAATWFWASSY